MKLNYILEKPIITEKSTQAAQKGEFSFRVKLTASKGAIASEVKKVFGVDVVSVRTLILPGKPKRVPGKREFAKLASWKKAIVKLKEGQKINLFSEKE